MTSESALGIGADTFTRARVARIGGVVIACGSTVLGAQALISALGGPAPEAPSYQLWVRLLVFVPLAVMLVAGFVGRGVRVAASAFVIAFSLAVVVWPYATAGVAVPQGEPWIWYLINVATAATVLTFSLPWQLLAAVAVPVAYGAARLTQVGWRSDALVTVGLQVVFAVILSGVVITIAWMLRTVARDMDHARADAVDSYAAAASADAAEGERVAVAALMHDSVLAALIAAERASSERERALAVTMAREALTRLANTDHDATEGPDDPVSPTDAAAALQRAATELGLDVRVRTRIWPEAPLLPGRVARAIVQAGVQALTNAQQHADATGLDVAFRADIDRLTVRVTDRGPGFDVTSVPEDRLGIRGSIGARMAAAGGQARIESGSRGTVVTLTWSMIP